MSNKPDFQPGVIIVGFKEGTTKEQIDALLAKYGMSVAKHLERIDMYFLNVPDGKDEEIVEALGKELSVEGVCLNLRMDLIRPVKTRPA
jgi:hypothetical protein